MNAIYKKYIFQKASIWNPLEKSISKIIRDLKFRHIFFLSERDYLERQKNMRTGSKANEIQKFGGCPLSSDGKHKTITQEGYFSKKTSCKCRQMLIENEPLFRIRGFNKKTVSKKEKELIRNLCIDKINYAMERIGDAMITTNSHYQQIHKGLTETVNKIKSENL